VCPGPAQVTVVSLAPAGNRNLCVPESHIQASRWSVADTRRGTIEGVGLLGTAVAVRRRIQDGYLARSPEPRGRTCQRPKTSPHLTSGTPVSAEAFAILFNGGCELGSLDRCGAVRGFLGEQRICVRNIVMARGCSALRTSASERARWADYGAARSSFTLLPARRATLVNASARTASFGIGPHGNSEAWRRRR
jgi:hypothetical protein